jgi:hypothetical protein
MTDLERLDLIREEFSANIYCVVIEPDDLEWLMTKTRELLSRQTS